MKPTTTTITLSRTDDGWRAEAIGVLAVAHGATDAEAYAEVLRVLAAAMAPRSVPTPETPEARSDERLPHVLAGTKPLTAQAFAAFVGMSPKAVYSHISRGTIPHRRSELSSRVLFEPLVAEAVRAGAPIQVLKEVAAAIDAGTSPSEIREMWRGRAPAPRPPTKRAKRKQ